jgi:dihydropteroate synthase
MKIFGILNLTPDSFSGSNTYQDAEQMLLDGADYIDVGAESTRPNATEVTPEEEWARLEPFFKTAKKIPISLDTRNPQTLKKALAYNNINFLNDVSGLQNDQMVQLAKNTDINVIVMHSLTVPADKNVVLTSPPVQTLKNWFTSKLAHLTAAGINPNKIIFDPGLGFGKNMAQSAEIVQKAPELAAFCHALGTKILYGHSRKSFLNVPDSQRDLETARLTRYLYAANVDFVRVHNVKQNLEAIK